MSYDSIIAGNESIGEVEMWVIDEGPSKGYYTSLRGGFQFDIGDGAGGIGTATRTFQYLPMTRSEILENEDTGIAEIKIALPIRDTFRRLAITAGLTVNQFRILRAFGRPTTVTSWPDIYSAAAPQAGQSPYTWFLGYVRDAVVRLDRVEATIRDWVDVLDGPMPAVWCQTPCNNDVYGPICRANRLGNSNGIPFLATGRITALSSLGNSTVTIDFTSANGGNAPLPDGYPSQWFDRGKIRLTELQMTPSTGRVAYASPPRMVISHQGFEPGGGTKPPNANVLDIHVPFHELVDYFRANGSIPDNRIEVDAGCDLSSIVCISKFGNIQHRVASESTPEHDPVTQGI